VTALSETLVATGQSGSPPNADCTLSFQPPFADAGDVHALLIRVRGGVVAGMALGPGNSRNFLGTAGGGQVPLTVLNAGAIAGFKIQNLPNVVEHVADVGNGDAIVVTAPMDAWSTPGLRPFLRQGRRECWSTRSLASTPTTTVSRRNVSSPAVGRSPTSSKDSRSTPGMVSKRTALSAT
jgi:hypothetical protein